MSAVSRIWLCLVLLHAGAALVVWHVGWLPGFLTLAAVHLGLLATTLHPGSTIFCPARQSFGGPERSVVLTIDDGPAGDTAAILDLLDRYQAKALFFLIGQRAAADPEGTRAIAARGHAVENHTLTHPEKWFWAYGPARQRREISETNHLLISLTGRAPVWFRAPAGFRNPFTGAVLRETNLTYLGWTARGFDTSDQDIPRVLARLRKGFQPGAVILVHQGHPHSLALLEALLETLRAEGWSTRLP